METGVRNGRGKERGRLVVNGTVGQKKEDEEERRKQIYFFFLFSARAFGRFAAPPVVSCFISLRQGFSCECV